MKYKMEKMQQKVLFLVFYGFNAYNGISKKIQYQIDALKEGGLDVRTCYYEVRADGHRQWLIDSQVIADLGCGVVAKLRKRLDFSPILRYLESEQIDLLYIRSYHNANPATIRFVKAAKRLGVRILLEIPTYPYDQEYQSPKEKLQLAVDRLYRHRFCRYVDKIITFSSDAEIFGRPTICISNGIDFRHIALRHVTRHDLSREIHLIAVAEIHFWHGYDRLIQGLGRYYNDINDTQNEIRSSHTKPSSNHPEVHFHLVGPLSGIREEQCIKSAIEQWHLDSYVHLHGRQSGKALDDLFDQADFAIGSLGRHRSGITHLRSLKNREYAARGFAFLYSEIDDDFEQQPYVLKAPADESPIDIASVVRFIQNNKFDPQTIRGSIQHLSWKEQMRKVIEQ